MHRLLHGFAEAVPLIGRMSMRVSLHVGQMMSAQGLPFQLPMFWTSVVVMRVAQRWHLPM